MCSGCKGVLLGISFPREGKTYRVRPSPRLAGVPWNVGTWVQEPVCRGSCRKEQVSTEESPRGVILGCGTDWEAGEGQSQFFLSAPVP